MFYRGEDKRLAAPGANQDQRKHLALNCRERKLSRSKSPLTGTPNLRHIVNGLIACKTICLKQINTSLLTLKSRSLKD